MTSYQSRLGDQEGIAEELAEGQRAISIAEFFEKNKHMLGFDSGARGLVTAVKEGVDNSLDACEEADILPDIYVEIQEDGDYYRVVIEDNGPGITKEQIPKIFGKLLYGSRFHKREQSLTPDQELLVRRDGKVESLPIGVLCDAYLPVSGESTRPIPDDIEVPSFNRETKEMSWQSVTHAIRHETDERTYEITTEKGRTVEVTGNHSVFTVTKDGETEEVKAGELQPGDTILAPRRLPSFEETVQQVNLLDYLTPEQLEDRRIYVYGFDRTTLEELKNGDKIRKKPSEDSARERTHYRYDGVDIPKDSLETNYLQKGYLPAEIVLELGWEEKAARQDCTFKTYQVGGQETEIPVSLPVSKDLMQLLGYYVTEDHVGPRQVGLTFGSHGRELSETTLAGIGGETTTVERERNSTRVKAFDSPLALCLKNVCGTHADTKRIPDFVFRADPKRQKQFLVALYRGDGSDSHPSNELSHTTTSETLARQLSLLWNMQGVVASTEVTDEPNGYSDDPSTRFRTKVYGADVTVLDACDSTVETGKQGYKRVPTSLLADVRVGTVHAKTVPDSIPGLLYGAGVGSSLEHAQRYRSGIESILADEDVDKSWKTHHLTEMGLLDDEGQPTEKLHELWGTIQNLHGLTDTDMCLLPVEEVEETEQPEYVYDISVPGATGKDENFVVANEGAISVKNSRGQQGIGISAAVLYAQLTSGKPAKVTSCTPGGNEAQYFEVIVDTDENEPEIKVEETTTWERPHGTRIELEMEANMRARRQLHDYIKHTAVVNPHTRIELKEPKAQFKYERVTDQLPAETEEIRPHPHGVELGTLIKMAEATDSYSVSGFLQEEFTRVGQKTADAVIDGFRDRHFGREMAWRPPQAHEEASIQERVREAVVNKGAEATADFAGAVADRLGERERVAHHQVVETVDEVGDEIQVEYGTTFGSTVRDNAVAAAWGAVTAERESDVYALVDAATTQRKDDAIVQALAERLAAKFDPGDRHRVTRDTLREYVDRAADMTEKRDDATFGDTARENIVEELRETAVRVPDDPPRISDVAGDRDTASDLLDAMRLADIMSPPTGCLAPITADLVEAGLKKEYDADFYAAATRDASVHGGDPFIVEAGLAYGGDVEDDGSADVLRFANRVPLVYQRGACVTTDVVKDINWRNYGLDQPGGRGIPNGPAVIMIHVASTNVPFTSESKDAIANVPEIEHEIELAIREAARELKSFLKERRSMRQRREKQNKLATILPEMAEKLARVTDCEPLNIDNTMARIMNDVLVERERDDDTVRLVVENNANTNATLDVTEIVTAEPEDVNGANVVEMDGEWFIKWEPTVKSGDETVLEYAVDSSADCTVSVDGIDDEKLTIDT
ncbi:DNA topoisomerase VI subunit B [Halobacteriales archaeon QH_2_65_14]|nr:MAG: DNA topoisomerase VI subunit B [Halobacteriales archaeon QH_2_65_14]